MVVNSSSRQIHIDFRFLIGIINKVMSEGEYEDDFERSLPK